MREGLQKAREGEVGLGGGLAARLTLARMRVEELQIIRIQTCSSAKQMLKLRPVSRSERNATSSAGGCCANRALRLQLC